MWNKFIATNRGLWPRLSQRPVEIDEVHVRDFDSPYLDRCLRNAPGSLSHHSLQDHLIHPIHLDS